MIHISPMIPQTRHDLGTFRKDSAVPYGRFFLACVTAVLLLGCIGGVALSVTRLSEIERIYAADARV
ncbi:MULTISPECIES: hypothetical protein [unclassified Agrobacterium]|uniref:hypothetical protein n=1 Tax=unclassified Agrobacterium TaxID=2632611 RepID=UPI00244D47ED|nr:MULTISPECIES: hypothetical protein [unclassified Agrobacterium]MDH0615898.1 hypothetical protein [Agrobacterium sp. GD03872]MDH0698013.1 hypothetical protein [Agrobacterium sp. GD03871]MDH1061098.1 hypothetical protein [Agrobacterium sp. GD03992]MDH2211870.1 hypothetical protein [Agrobacterium sp. GD03643]MDH2221262.1 hypothetical protein [Agrobacterium sp. GD03638]